MIKYLSGTTRILSLFVFIYVLLRAIVLDITYDEAWSIGTYVNGSFLNILRYEPCDSNNHLINSLLIKVLYLVLPESTLVARLPGLISLILYLYFAAKLTQAEKSLTGFLIFLTLILNPYLLEFFGLARGYGMALAALMVAVYQLKIYFETHHRRSLILALLSAGLAGLSILSFLNFFAGILGLVFLHLLVVRRKNYPEVLACLSLSAGLITAILWVPLHRLTQFGNLYYGGKTSLWSDTFLSLGRYTQYQMFETKLSEVLTTVFMLVILFLLIIAYVRDKKISWQNSFLLILGLSCLLINYLQVKLLGGYYLIDRTALFLYPLILLTLWQGLQNTTLKMIFLSPLVGIVFMSILNFSLHANLSKTLTWFFDAHTREILNQINKKGESEQRIIPVGCSWPFEKTLVWYLRRGEYPHVEFRWDPEYYLYLDGSLDQIDYYPARENLAHYKGGILLQYPTEHVFVLQR